MYIEVVLNFHLDSVHETTRTEILPRSTAGSWQDLALSLSYSYCIEVRDGVHRTHTLTLLMMLR